MFVLSIFLMAFAPVLLTILCLMISAGIDEGKNDEKNSYDKKNDL